MITEDLFKELKQLAFNIIGRGNPSEKAGLFLIKITICLYSQGLGIIEKESVISCFNSLINEPEKQSIIFTELFNRMSKIWVDCVFFKGEPDTIELQTNELSLLLSLADWDWLNIDPMIFGKMQELLYNPKERTKHGAFYTHDRDMMMKIINPVIVEPLLKEWEEVKARIRECLSKAA